MSDQAAPAVPASMTLAEAALDYARAGRVAFPVRGKDEPLVKFGHLEPGPLHVLQVRAWWHHWPDANVALRTGDGLVVIDVDPKHGGVWDPNWPVTRTETTPSGGAHLFYWTPAHVGGSVGKLARGVDVRGHHNYVVAAPSPGYVLEVDAPIAEMPDELVAAAQAVGRRRREDGELPPNWRPFDPAFEPVPKGERHDYLMRFGGWYWNAGAAESENDLEEAMWIEAERILVDPPSRLDDDQARRMWLRVEYITGAQR